MPLFSNNNSNTLYIKVKTTEGVRKAYIASFVCCTTRACHLQLVLELPARTFLLRLRRFMARSGVPNLITRIARKHLKPWR